ncbi:MAG: 4-hydroxythreonine-4-phosphate dehydrogenase PdxA, partial [Spirochaetales bacterium]|nr:4-hydroxythreonine-4-phosphate dehydrogenase PdxA [Spirochaetales bacterium]
IGISMGDPAGIGPEIIVKALTRESVWSQCCPVVVGDARVMEQAVRFLKSDLAVEKITEPEQADPGRKAVYVYDLANADPADFTLGEVSVTGGTAAYRAVEKVIELAMKGAVAATVTAPINKEAINRAGFKYSGHTEIYAHYTGTSDYAMMLAHEDFRVIHVSTHVSLREACDRVSRKRVLDVISLADENLKKMGLPHPRIAVAGLNPHAGENGLFGREEIEEIAPAVESAKLAGIDASGPFPPDTIFSMAKGGMYDIVVVMYHDQGHIPLKLTGFIYDREAGKWQDVSGVNITLGLPIIRTSVDHGTAFDQAGKGTASSASMVNAIEYAVKLGGFIK